MVSKEEIHKNIEVSLGKIPVKKYYQENVLPKRFHLNGNTLGLHPQTQKLELHVPCESIVEEVSFEW